MGTKNKTRLAGTFSIIASSLMLIVFGLAFVLMAGYTLITLVFLGALGSISGQSGETGLAGALFVLVVFAILVPLVLTGILGCVFGVKMQRMGLVDNGSFYMNKARLITYDVFLFIFFVISFVAGFFMLKTDFSGSSDTVSFLSKIPMSFVSAVLYLLAGIFLSIDIAKNKEKFKLAKEGKLTVQSTTPQPVQSIAPQQQPQPQLQIITLKEGEEIPEHLKGRLVPVEKKDDKK